MRWSEGCVRVFKELSPWFEFPCEDWIKMYEYGIEKTIGTDQTIFTVNDRSENIFIIKEGRVRLFHTSHEGKEKALIIMCNGTIIGDSQLGGFYFEEAITASETTYVEFGKKRFEELMNTDHTLLKHRIDFLNKKSQTLAVSNLLISCYDAETRIRYAIFHLAKQFGTPLRNGAIRIFMQFTQQELADLVGTSRVTVANMINSFVQQGLITKDGRFYIIPSIERIIPDE